jgi:hypothetical protein
MKEVKSTLGRQFAWLSANASKIDAVRRVHNKEKGRT